MSVLHVVVGAGQIGTPLAKRLVADGHRVRMLRQSAQAIAAGVEVVPVDIADAVAVQKATDGAAVMYHCANPDYFAALWERLLPSWDEAVEQEGRNSRAGRAAFHGGPREG